MKDIIVLNNKTALDIFKPDGVQSIFAYIRKEATAFVPDVSTEKGRKQIASQARKVSTSKVLLENARKTLVADWTKKTKAVNEHGKVLRDNLDILRDAVRRPYTDWERAEEKRKEDIKITKEIEEAHAEAITFNELYNRQKEIERKEAAFAKIEDEKRKKEEAKRQDEECIAREKQLIADALKEEREETEKALKKAENDRIEDLAKAKYEKMEAIESAKRQEQKRLADIQAEKERKLEAVRLLKEKAAQRKSHQRLVNNNAVKCLIDNVGIDETTAKKVICSIAKYEIVNVIITY